MARADASSQDTSRDTSRDTSSGARCQRVAGQIFCFGEYGGVCGERGAADGETR
jgi:hypothetical protein